MKLNRILISMMLVASSLFSVEAQVVDYGQANGVFSFEDSIEGLTWSKYSVLDISDEHAKLGSNSLEWNWKKGGAHISINSPVPYLAKNPNPKETSVSSFVFWIYSPEHLNGDLRFSFMKDGKECCHFTYNLGFEGWRGAWVAFDRDMEGTPEEGMDQVVITTSDNLKKGKLFFDGIITASFQDVRYHTADWQARFINKETTNFWLTLNKFWDNQFDFQIQKGILSEKDTADFKTIEDRFITLVTDGIKPLSIEEIRKIYGTYNITFNTDGTINGKPIWFIRYGETYLNQGIPDAMPSFTAHGQTLRQLNDSMLKIAVSYMNETELEIKEEIAQIYVNLTRHLLDQGFAAGSGQGTLHHLGYSMRNFYTGPVIMKSVLQAAGLADDTQQAMEWFCGAGEVKTAPEVLGMDIDAFNTSLMGRFASVIMLEDSPYKQAYMKAVSRWVDNGFKHTEGLRPSFKRDGCVVHHRKCYPEYAVGGFRGSVNAIWMLARTGFAVSEESHENQKQALLQMRFFSNLKNFPVAMSGRHPDGTRSLIPSQYALLADAGTPDGTSEIDADLAAAYLRLDGTSGRWAEKFIAAGIEAEKAPTGGRNLAYNCSLSYRQEDWLITFAGHSRYLWAAETYNRENHYGRYLTHGSMQYLNEGGSLSSGFRQEGWDWCHIPGTTAAERPMVEMKADVLNVDEFSGYEEMLLSDEWFAGGVTYGNKAAAYSMKLHEHDKYNGSLRANKSFFAFGNRIVCLGSGLENSLEGSELHTTLFQNWLPEHVDNSIAEYNDANTTLSDVQGNVYYIKDGDVVVKSGLQHSYHEETDAPTEGYFEKAYIRHGKDSYEYMAAIQPTEAQKSAYAEELPYVVERCDNIAHIVYDKENELKACAAFDKTSVDETILNVTPSMFIYKVSDDILSICISNPDLALYSGPSDEVFDEEGKRKERSVYGRKWIENPSQTKIIELEISGEWNVAETGEGPVHSKFSDGNTIVLIETTEARTEKLILNRK